MHVHPPRGTGTLVISTSKGWRLPWVHMAEPTAWGGQWVKQSPQISMDGLEQGEGAPGRDKVGTGLICSWAESLCTALTAQGRGRKAFGMVPTTGGRRALSRPVYRGGRGTWS